MIIGYARVSTADQNLNLQIDDLTNKAKCEKIYQEHISATKANRPEFTKCLADLRGGDTLVVWRLDRLGRSLQDLTHIVNDLKARGVNLWCMQENLHMTHETNSTGELIFNIFAMIAQYEKSVIQERTRAGLTSARERGRHGGRRSKLNATDVNIIKELMANPNNSSDQVAKRFLVSVATIYKVVRDEYKLTEPKVKPKKKRKSKPQAEPVTQTPEIDNLDLFESEQ